MGERATKAVERPADLDVTTFSNSIRLSGREWLVVGLFAVLLSAFGPTAWKRVEPFTPGTDYRMPHDLSSDYWLYERYAGLAAQRYDTLLIGDSVIWGEYVTGQETLSHYLNEETGRERFGNLGLDGAHPLALGGLVEHYAGSVTRKNVVLQCNPLWLTSARRDLQDDKADEANLNHSALLPQFVPHIPSYPLTREKLSGRIGIVVERYLPPGSWTTHLQQAYYDQSNIPNWTRTHPYDNPVAPLGRGLPPADSGRRHLPQPWYESGITPQDFPWVDPETSLQWHAFQRVVEVLRRRDNRLFVLVGPFNEHLLKPQSARRYQEIKGTIVAWLEAQGVPYSAPGPLPSPEYGDASHPLAQGYERLARQLLGEPFFREGK
jgi:hypothetical protein